MHWLHWVQPRCGETANSLVIAQQNYNEIKWKQLNISVENDAKARLEWGVSCKKSTTASSRQKLQVKRFATTFHIFF